MRTICFKSFKELPAGVFAVYMIALVMAISGGVMIILDCLGKTGGMLKYEMFLVVCSVWINNIILFKYKDRIYK